MFAVVDGNKVYGQPGYRHPYMDYEGTPMWCWVRKGIRDLVNNQDLVENEDRNYIVGYICKVISKAQKKERAKRTSAVPYRKVRSLCKRQ